MMMTRAECMPEGEEAEKAKKMRGIFVTARPPHAPAVAKTQLRMPPDAARFPEHDHLAGSAAA